MILSLRLKFTFYYLMILLTVLLIFGISIYAYLAHSVEINIDESLNQQIIRLEKAVKQSTRDSMMDEGNAQIDGNLTNLPEDDTEPVQMTPHLLEVIDMHGVTRTESYAHTDDRVPFSMTELMRLPLDQTIHQTVRTAAGKPLRLAIRRAKGYDGEDFFVRLGESLASFERARKRLLLALLIAIPLALILGSYGGLVLANQALHPVDVMTRTAERISASDLSKRVPVPEQLPERQDEIARLAATFNQMIGRLQAAFERQKQFTSDASHELRTPLAVLRGDIEITLRRERTPAEYQRTLSSALEEVVRLSRLVEDLLMLARADAGRVELQQTPFDFAELCQDMVAYITPLAEQRQQQLTYDVPTEPVIIQADLQRIKQLLVNLLDNAIKYTEPKGQIAVRVTKERHSVVLTIADSGRGIPPEDLPHIYDRFFRRSASTSDRSAPGSGLGLSIVKWIVEAHRGKIEAQSKVSTGTTFTVKLPLLAGGKVGRNVV